ncbi:MAG: hypothetical protein JXP36_15345 [Bacteroidales bacterium]|nr:hypothetical protein [Bacteroidales bacterium]
MKQITIILALLLGSYFSFSQEKTEFGISTEGSWFIPHKEPEYRGWETKNGFGTGIGVYASRNLFWKVSANIGVSYRYKQMQQHYVVYPETSNGYYPYGYGDYYPYVYDNSPYGYGTDKIEGWDKLPMHYFVVPVHLKMLLTKNYFIKGGIETTWLTNYEVVNEKPEFNWSIGLGSQKYKLKWSLNYISGFKEQGFGDKTMEADGHYKGSINKNNMLQLQLSYPIGRLKF